MNVEAQPPGDAAASHSDAGRSAAEPFAFPAPTSQASWLFIVEGFDPVREREVETWLTVANGRTGTRGSLEEGSAGSAPLTLVAGAFGDATGNPPNREPIPAADWVSLILKIDDSPLDLGNGVIVGHRRIQDMRQAIVFRDWQQRDRWGRLVHVRTARFASAADRSVLAIRAQAIVVDGEVGQMLWETPSYVLAPVRATTEIDILRLDDGALLTRTWGRNGGRHSLALATIPTPGSHFEANATRNGDSLGGHVGLGDTISVDRLCGVAASDGHDACDTRAQAVLEQAMSLGFDELLRRHTDVWSRTWHDCDLRIEGDREAQRAARFSIYHMVSSADSEDSAVSIGARGLSGMSYFMHVFWDTEIFVVPFFIYSFPEVARALLAYRHANLDGARAKAAHLGFRGALFPWESADHGAETTPEFARGPHGEQIPILSGLMEHHISADVAWAVWEYWRATGDDAFMADMGVEILLETARFWASRSTVDDAGTRHIAGIVGPDEYHEDVTDNAFTNRLAIWNIEHALRGLDWLRDAQRGRTTALLERLQIDEGELGTWRTVAETLVDGLDPDTGIFEQFAGFHAMDEVPLEKLRPRPMPADLLLGRDVTLRSKVIKQADVVMLCHVLAEEIDRDTVRANFDYYEPITVHGSSLSPGIHAAVAARLGRMETAEECFRMACAVDLADNMGNASSGLHMATMGGIWQAAVKGFAGLRRWQETLVLDPHLPDGWSRVAFPVRFRGARLHVEVEHQRAIVDVRQGSVTLLPGHDHSAPVFRLDPGRHVFFRGADGSWTKGEP